MNQLIKGAIGNYSDEARTKFIELRALILTLAKENSLGQIEEALKWSQPAFLSRFGSTIRVHWHVDNPTRMELLFNCKTVLVETFKELFGDELKFGGNRIVYVDVSAPIPPEIETCLLMALNYHRLKKRPLLGA